MLNFVNKSFSELSLIVYKVQVNVDSIYKRVINGDSAITGIVILSERVYGYRNVLQGRISPV